MRRNLRWRGSSEQDLVDTVIVGDDIYKEPSFLEKVSNRIYFYSDVEREKVLQLNRSIRELNGELQVKQKELDLAQTPKIYVHINSFGGEIFAGLSSVDEIIKSEVPVVSVIDGCAASAATLMSVVAKERYINRHAYMLVHQLSAGFWGKHKEFKDELENQKQFMKIIKNIYKEYTRIPEKKLDEMLEHDLWWDAETCKRYGLVDEIL